MIIKWHIKRPPEGGLSNPMALIEIFDPHPAPPKFVRFRQEPRIG